MNSRRKYNCTGNLNCCIWTGETWGPVFGGGHDIAISNQSNQNK